MKILVGSLGQYSWIYTKGRWVSEDTVDILTDNEMIQYLAKLQRDDEYWKLLT